MLYDTIINGQTRKVVSHFGRNGFFLQSGSEGAAWRP